MQNHTEASSPSRTSQGSPPKTKFRQKFAFAEQLPIIVSFNTKALLVHSGFRAFPTFLIKKIQKHICARIPIPMSCEIVQLQTKIPAPQTLGMESSDFRKCGRRNLGARWEGENSKGPSKSWKLQHPAMQPMTISLVSQRVSDSMGTQEVHPTRQDKLDKHNSSTWRCDTGMRKSIGGARQTVQAHCKSRPHPPPQTNYSATTKERQKTDIGK